ncbi:flagellar motor switch protein FliG [Anaeromyxobacter diazotrophicus]|uniref:Flagellar motor switch protein FliG n=1 Tax=Anaeromyxobacter diazotrophicus TaxID=2590199 RepID=A0A7I9VKT3_9BACT|nr:flagellar motor switch protein FliG [Anaeromyxobacter diazotrophicus]GEJ56995.1 flagellar motor switch protein FliG [Anaeromyxobacter diazotrophicus]
MPDETLTPAGDAPPPPEPGPGLARAAAVLLGLGPEAAGSLFRQLGEGELRLVALGAKGLRKQSPGAVPDALRSFVDAMESLGGDTLASDHLLREAAVKALGADAARAFDGTEPPPPPDEALGHVSHADPESLAMVLSHEQPQTVALVLSSLEPARAAAVVERIPEQHRADILRRMAVIDAVAPEVLREIGQALTSELKALVAGGMRKVNGKAVALEILRRCSAQQQGEVIAEIEKDSSQLAAELRGRLFTFDDLRTLSDRDLQTLLREIDTTKLAIALKGATPELKQKLLSNLSARAAEMLEDDLQAMGPVKLSTVETAQGEIAKLTQEVAQQGRITIVGANETML